MLHAGLLVYVLASQSVDPCKDAAYIELRTRTLSDMTEVERSYYLEKDRFCMDALRRKAVADSLAAPVPPSRPHFKPARPSPSNAAAPISIGANGGFMAGLAALILVIRIVTL